MKLIQRVALTLAVIVLLCGIIPCAQSGGRFAGCSLIDSDSDSHAARTLSSLAKLAYAELRACRSSLPSHWYARYEPAFVYETAWALSQEIESTLAMMQLDPTEQLQLDLEREVDSLHYYWEDGSPGGYDSDVRNVFYTEPRYYDDNAWIGIALIEAHEFEPKNRWLLERAQQLFKLAEHGAENTENLPHAGGVFWTQKAGDSYRATVSTAAASQLALMLYQLTGDDLYLKFAQQEFAWVDRTLRAANGLYQDGIHSDGSKEPAEFTYNQGLMIGDAVLLFRSTGDRHYLAEAEAIGDAAVEYYSGERLCNQPAIFNAILFKNLLILNAVTPDNRYQQTFSAYARKCFENGLTRSGLSFGHELERASLDQSAKVQILASLWRIARNGME